MNAVEIEEAISELAGRPFGQAAFPYAFLEAFGNKATTKAKAKLIFATDGKDFQACTSSGYFGHSAYTNNV